MGKTQDRAVISFSTNWSTFQIQPQTQYLFSHRSEFSPSHSSLRAKGIRLAMETLFPRAKPCGAVQHSGRILKNGPLKRKSSASYGRSRAVGEQEGDGTKVDLSPPLDAGCRKKKTRVSPSLGKAFPPGRCLPPDA